MTNSREVWAGDGLYVRIRRTVDGGVEFAGQDVRPNPFGDSDYEYTLTASPEDIPKIVANLKGGPDEDLLDLIEANIETIVRTGEMTWLKSLGIAPAFWSYP